MQKMQELDFKKYYMDKPDPLFSPKRNREIIEGTIKKYEKMRAKRLDDYREKIRERADAVAMFLKYKDRGGQKDVENYLGQKILMQLKAQQIVSALKTKYTAKGKTKFARLDDVNNY